MGQGQGRYTPTRTAPAGVNTRTVCEMLGWSMEKLFGHVRRGEVPPPVWFGGEMLWPLNYTLVIRSDGLHLPGTYPGFPAGCDESIERRRWFRIGGEKNLRYTADKKRATAKAAKKRRQK